MNSFLNTIQPYLTITKDIFTIISLVIAGVVAIKGLQTWRRQLKGTSNYDLAKRLLKSTYKLRDAIQSVRNPLITEGEMGYAAKETQLDTKPSDENYHASVTAAVYQMRWKPVGDAYQSLELEAVEAEAVWGADARSATNAFRKSINSLSVALDFFLRDMQPRGPKMLDNAGRDTFEKIVFSVPGADDDAYLKELTSNVEKIEELIRPYLVR